MAEMDFAGGSLEADHLCVLVHGLWGNPKHMINVAKSLRAQYPPEQLHLLLAKRNSGSFTYDGIELGGERVCTEIVEEMAIIESKGGKIKKLSIVGYSLGGLVSRYAVGLLHAKGTLDTVECVNFTTFATPHLGVRQPLKGWYNYLINNLGARTLSESGRQLFTIDKFRDNNRPLLSVMAASDSIFMAGLRKFQRHTLYCNVVNDRAVSYYTAGISKTDPYDKQLDTLNVNHLPGWDGVILDPNEPYFTTSKDELTMPPKVSFGRKWAKRTPLILAGVTLLPLGVTAYLLSSVYHTCRSANRIKLHEAGRAGINIEEYRIPLWIREVRGEVERAYETLNVTQDQGHLENDEDGDDASLTSSDGNDRLQLERRKSLPAQPTLALTPDQFDMIDSLNTLPWRKYPVWIRENSHSHAVIVVRMDRDAYHEGRKVLEHWSTTEFLA